MARLEIGIVLPIGQYGPERVTVRWPELRAMAVRAEEIGFDTIWTPDELLWRAPAGEPPRGFWEGISMAGAVAAVTQRVTVGTWVMSALQRNAGIIAKAAETLDAICAEVGRDPATLGRSVGVSVNPTIPASSKPDLISGSAGEIADAFRSFRDAGFTRLEIMFGPGTMEALEALAPVVEQLHED